MSDSDIHLARAWADGCDRRALRTLYDRHARSVYTFAHGMVGNGHNADDVVQETFLKAAVKMSKFRGEASFKTWLISIAKNVAHDIGRKEAKRRRDAVREEPERENPTPPEELKERERKKAVRKAVDSLPEKQRLAITLVSLQGMTIAEASRALGWKEGTVKSTLSRARGTLKEKLRTFMDE